MSLTESIVLLFLTAAISGLLIPLVLRTVDQGRTTQLKDRESQLDRQARVIDAQSKLLDDLTADLWRWRYISIKLTYYGEARDEPRYTEVEREYDNDLWEIMNSIRNEVSRSRRLLSEAAYERLELFYRTTMVSLGRDIDRMRAMPIRAQSTNDEPHLPGWSELNSRIYRDVTREIDDLLRRVADDAKLAIVHDGSPS